MKMSLTIQCLALALILALGVAAGCIRSPDREYGGKGEILSIAAHKPKLLDRVVYDFQGQSYVITPMEEGAKIAALKARVVNFTSTQVTMFIDEASVTLNGTEGEQFSPFKPGTRAEKTTEEAPEDNTYGSHLWGRIQPRKGFHATGWFFFEVPAGTEFVDVAWDDVEFVRVPYPR